MERRTQPGYEYHSCDFMDEALYIDMNLLRECEDTGLTPPEIKELKNRDTELEPERAPLEMGGRLCPSCGKKVLPWDGFCRGCGQRLFWKEL